MNIIKSVTSYKDGYFSEETIYIIDYPYKFSRPSKYPVLATVKISRHYGESTIYKCEMRVENSYYGGSLESNINTTIDNTSGVKEGFKKILSHFPEYFELSNVVYKYKVYSPLVNNF